MNRRRPQAKIAKADGLLRVKPRRQFHRVFLDWLADNGHRFSIDLAFCRRTDEDLTLSFVGINPMISASIGQGGMCITVTWQGECWDFLGDWDSVPKKFPRGYACKLCHNYFRQQYPGNEFTKFFETREDVWIDCVFEPFLEWVNTELAPARWIKLCQYRGATWAKLLNTCGQKYALDDMRMRNFIDTLNPLESPGDQQEEVGENDFAIYVFCRQPTGSVRF